MTALYYIHGKIRYFSQGFKDIAFPIKYNNKIKLGLIDDFENYCRDYIIKKDPEILEFKLLGWSKIDG